MSKPMTAKQIAAEAEAMELPKLTDMLLLVKDVDTTPARRKILATKCLTQGTKWNKGQKARYAEVSPKTWYEAEHDPKFRQLCIEFTQERIGLNAPEFWARYVELALDGDRQALERVLQQLGVLDKPEKGGDTNINVIVTVEEREKLKREEEKGLARFIDRCGYDLVVSDN